MICLSFVNLSIQINATNIVYWTIPGCWLKWILGYFLFSVEESNRWVFFGGTMKLWRDRLQYDAKKTPMCHYDPSINVYHLFEKSCLFSISHFDLPLLLLVFSFDPRHNTSRMGTIITEEKTQQLRSNPRCSIHTSSLQALFLKSKNPGMFSKRSGLKCFELRPYRAISIHVHMCMGEFCHFMIIFLSHELWCGLKLLTQNFFCKTCGKFVRHFTGFAIITWNNPKKIGETLHHQGTIPVNLLGWFSHLTRFLWRTPFHHYGQNGLLENEFGFNVSFHDCFQKEYLCSC